MKKHILAIIFSLYLITSCGKNQGKNESYIPSDTIFTISNNFYEKGEFLRYSAKLGLLKAAEIKLWVDTNLYKIDTTTCYKVTLLGNLDGSVDLFSNLDDRFYSYVDTSNQKPKIAIRDLKENKYKYHEYTYFDFFNNKAKVVNKTSNKPDSIKYFDISSQMYDMISAYFQLRKVDFNKYSTKDTISIDAFIDNKPMNIKFTIGTKEVIKTKIGNFKSVVLVPIVPENDLLRGENPLSVWISDDDSRIPLKLKAKSWVGNIEVDLKEYHLKQIF